MYGHSTGRFANPELIVTHFHLREGDVVADFGAGSGAYMKPLSHAVGKGGKVYLCEIQKNLVETLGNHARESRLSNVHTMWCDLEASQGIRLKDGTLDAALLSNTLFQIEHKETALKEMARTIRTGGKFFVVDWSDSFGGLGPRQDHLVLEDETRTLLERAGFTVEHTFPAGDHHYGLACRKR